MRKRKLLLTRNLCCKFCKLIVALCSRRSTDLSSIFQFLQFVRLVLICNLSHLIGKRRNCERANDSFASVAFPAEAMRGSLNGISNSIARLTFLYWSFCAARSFKLSIEPPTITIIWALKQNVRAVTNALHEASHCAKFELV